MVPLHSTFTSKKGSSLSFYKLYKYNNKFSLKRVFINVFNCFWVVISKDHVPDGLYNFIVWYNFFISGRLNMQLFFTSVIVLFVNSLNSMAQSNS